MNLTALKFPAFRRFALGNICALFGLWIQRLILGWLAWEQTRSAAFVGFVAALSLLPTLFSGPFFGVLADRGNIKIALFSVLLAIMTLILSLLAILSAGFLSPAVLSCFALLFGLVMSAHHPVRLSLAPRLVPREQVASVVAITSMMFNLARLVAPALGGYVIQTWGVEAALRLAVFLYLPALIVVPFLYPREARSGTDEQFFHAFRQGFDLIRRSPVIRRSMLIIALFSMTGRGVLEVLPIVADGIFSRGAVGLGVLTGSVGGGALLAALAKTLGPPQTGSKIPANGIRAVFLGWICVAVLGASTLWGLTILAATILGFSTSYAGITLQSAVQLRLPDDMRGRVMSIWVAVAIGMVACGSLVFGLLTEFIGLPLASVGLSGATAVILLIVLLRD